MNISSNNMKWFSGYPLMNRLFSQKSGNKTGVSNQMGADISGELAGEMEKLQGQRAGGTYGIADQMEDSVRAYGNLYDEIVQGYQNGTRERYVEM